MDTQQTEDCVFKLFDDKELDAANPYSKINGFAAEVKKLIGIVRSCGLSCSLRWLVVKKRTDIFDPQAALIFVDSKEAYAIRNCLEDEVYGKSLFINDVFCDENLLVFFYNPNPVTGSLNLEFEPDSSEQEECESDFSEADSPAAKWSEQILRLRAALQSNSRLTLAGD